jgi:hypothetical protein
MADTEIELIDTDKNTYLVCIVSFNSIRSRFYKKLNEDPSSH